MERNEKGKTENLLPCRELSEQPNNKYLWSNGKRSHIDKCAKFSGWLTFSMAIFYNFSCFLLENLEINKKKKI